MTALRKTTGAVGAARLRALVVGWAAILACTSVVSLAQHAVNLPAAADLRADAEAARARRIPILLFFDRYDCPYCDRALRQFLVPMSTDPEWKDRAVFRQVEIEEGQPLIDFKGGRVTHAAFAGTFSVRLSPTIVVVDWNGKPLGDPIVGLLTPDFYGAYVENAITSAASKLNTQ